MPKLRSVFVCQQCGNESAKWAGQCSACGEWNSMAEMAIGQRPKSKGQKERRIRPQKLSEVRSINRRRIQTGIGEFDRVLGGGIVPGSIVLVAGDPGIGKSTLMLQVIDKVGGLYVTGEESLEQVKLRSERLGIQGKETAFLAETDVDIIVTALNLPGESRAALVVVDSIQTLQTEDLSGVAGSVGQVRESALRLLRIAKPKGLPVFIVGHVTKAGAIAGPKVLEHMVDTVLYFEGERLGNARLLRTTKNRFGATDEVGIFEMKQKGLEPVSNPSKLFLKERQKKSPGSVVLATMEGTRPVLTEVQALVVPTQLAVPRRVGRGVDYNRLQLIVAVLSKQLGLSLGNHDIFVNVAGGLKIEEPAADLAIAFSIISSYKNQPVDEKTVAFGELGLLGEIREVASSEKRSKEARRLGFTKVICPDNSSSVAELNRKLLEK